MVAGKWKLRNGKIVFVALLPSSLLLQVGTSLQQRCYWVARLGESTVPRVQVQLPEPIYFDSKGCCPWDSQLDLMENLNNRWEGEAL